MNMAGIIDVHTHILPGIDDGAKTPEMSVQMLQSLKQQGVTAAVLTSHYYTHKMRMEDFLHNRQNAFELLKAQGGEQILPLFLGAETYLTDYIFNYEDISPVCISGTRYLLTELSFHSKFGSSTFNRIHKLIGNFSVVPILAHVERYEPIIRNKAVAEELLDMGCLFQANLSSFSSKNRALQKRMLRMAEQGYIHLLGTDCHNMDSRSPDVQSGLQVIQKKLGFDYVEAFAQNGRQVLNGDI